MCTAMEDNVREAYAVDVAEESADRWVELELDGRFTWLVHGSSVESVEVESVAAASRRAEEAFQRTSELICRREVDKAVLGLIYSERRVSSAAHSDQPDCMNLHRERSRPSWWQEARPSPAESGSCRGRCKW